MTLHETRGGSGFFPSSYQNYLSYRERSGSFRELVSFYSGAPIQTVLGNRVEVLSGSVVSDNYFKTFAVRPQLGRFFSTEETQIRGGRAVVVLSDRIWHDWLGGDPAAVGAVLSLNGVPFEVIGVAPERFHGVSAGGSDDFWISSSMSHVGYRWCDSFARDCTYLDIIGLLEDDVTLAEARVELEVIAEQLESAYPEANREAGIAVVRAWGVGPGNDRRRRLTSLLGLVALTFLLVACTNLAGLLLARNSTRRRELAVRVSLGAGRRQLVQQLLVEALIIALVGGACGFVVTYAVRPVLMPYYSFDAAWMSAAGGLAPALLATLVLTTVVAAAFGLLPALAATRQDDGQSLRVGTATTDQRQSRLRAWLVIAQIALSFSLLIAGAHLVASLRHVSQGLVAKDDLLLLRLRPRLVEYDVEVAAAFHRRVIERLEAMPEVVAVAFAQGWPHSPYGLRSDLSLPGDAEATARAVAVANDAVGPGYFAAIGVPVLRGRDFDERDRRGAALAVAVNQTLARALWGSADPVGRRVRADGRTYEVIALVADVFQHSHAEAPVPYFYRSYDQAQEPLIDSRVSVRTVGDAGSLAGRVRELINDIDPLVPISEMESSRSKLRTTFRSLELTTMVTSASGALALLLAAVGLFALLSSTVERRTREIGIRQAVGAARREIGRLVLGSCWRWTGLGLLLGLPAAAALSTLLASSLYGVHPLDLRTHLAVAVLLLVVVSLSVWAPLRRALAIEPMECLRVE